MLRVCALAKLVVRPCLRIKSTHRLTDASCVSSLNTLNQKHTYTAWGQGADRLWGPLIANCPLILSWALCPFVREPARHSSRQTRGVIVLPPLVLLLQVSLPRRANRLSGPADRGSPRRGFRESRLLKKNQLCQLCMTIYL